VVERVSAGLEQLTYSAVFEGPAKWILQNTLTQSAGV
jgi:hypothetical protein